MEKVSIIAGFFALGLSLIFLTILLAMAIPWISNIIDMSYDNARKYECEKAGMKWHYEPELIENGAVVVCGY